MTWGVYAAFASLAAFVGFALWRRHRRISGFPTTWIQEGVPPAGITVALDVIRQCAPKPLERFGGRIKWVPDLFESGGVRVAGVVTDIEMPAVTVTFFSDVTKTAVAHEIGHHIWKTCFGRLGQDGFHNHDPDFIAWVTSTNQRIREELARRGLSL